MNNMDIRTIFTQNLKYYRNSCNYTQATLGELTNLTDKYISDLERGKYDPSLSTLISLARAFNIEPYLLLKYDKSHSIDNK